MKYTITFTKQAESKYISHLDLQRVFVRAFKRSGLHLKYTNGFHPHPKLCFAQPLSLGYTSLCEVLEFELNETVETAVLGEKLGKELPRGIALLECLQEDDGLKSIASRCKACEWLIAMPVCSGDCAVCGAGKEKSEEEKEKRTRFFKGPQELVDEYLAQDEIIEEKLNKKKKTVTVDIRKMIEYMIVNVSDGKLFMSTKLSAGSEANLSPELLFASFCRFTGLDYNRETVEIMRTEMYM